MSNFSDNVQILEKMKSEKANFVQSCLFAATCNFEDNMLIGRINILIGRDMISSDATQV